MEYSSYKYISCTNQDITYNNKWFYFCILYLATDLCRIHEFIPGASIIRPGLIVTLILSFYLINGNEITLAYKLGHPQIKYITYFALLLCIYVPFASGERDAFNTAVGVILFLPYILSSIVLVNSKYRLDMLWNTYVFIVSFIIIYCLTHSGRGPGGSVGDENDACLFIVTFLPFIFHTLSQETRKYIKLFWVTIVLLGIAAVVATMSRGGLLGLIAMCTVFWYFSRKKIIMLLCFILISLGVYYWGSESYKNKMSTTINIRENTANERLLSWEAGWKMFLNKPLGVGGNNFPRHFADFQSEELQRRMWGRQAHSLWFTLLPETGVLGLWIFMMILYTNIKDINRIRLANAKTGSTNIASYIHSMSICLTASFAGFLVAGSFLSVLYYPIFWYLTSLIICFKSIVCNIETYGLN